MNSTSSGKETLVVEGGTHSTGMHSCLVQFLPPTNEVFWPGNIFTSICMSRRGVLSLEVRGAVPGGVLSLGSFKGVLSLEGVLSSGVALSKTPP